MSSSGSSRRAQAAAALHRTCLALAGAVSPRRQPARLAAAALLAACSDATAPRSVDVEPNAQPRFQISDAARGGRQGFYLLPPLVADPGPFTGTFDGGLPATARVCLLDAARTACASDVQTFAVGAAGGQAITVNTVGQSYDAIWGATQGLTPSSNGPNNVRYRVEVAVGGMTLGFADLWVARNAQGLRSLPAGFVGLVQGAPLQIKFRIETRAVGTVTVAPSTASVPVGGTQAFTATVTNLRGEPASADGVAWTTSAATVATLAPATGGTTTATGAGVGPATITASVGGVSAGATLMVVVTAAPVPVNDQYGTTAGATLTVPDGSTDLLANDNLGTPAAALASFGGGSLGGAVTDHAVGSTATAGTGGSLTVNANGSLTYTPAAGFTGPFTFQYRLTHAAGSVDATVTINVAKAPSAVADAYTTPRNTALVTAAPGLLANDDRGAPLGTITRFAIGILGAAGTGSTAGSTIPDGNGGTLLVNADGSFTFTPANASTAGVSFQYELANAVGTSVSTATIGVTEAPAAQADAYTATGGTLSTAAPGVLANDNRGAPQAVVAAFGGGSLGGAVTDRAAGTAASFGTGGSLTVNADGSVRFTRSAGFSGDFTFQYRLASTSGSSDATVTITVPAPPTAVADAAAAASAPGQAFHTALSTALAVGSGATPNLLVNDDRGVPAGTITSFGGGSVPGTTVTSYAAGNTVTIGTNGALTVNADGTASFTPSQDFTGLFTVQYRLTNSGGTSDATVTIAVGVRPSAANDTYTPALVGNVPISTTRSTQFSVSLNDAGDRRTLALVPGSGVGGTPTLDVATGKFDFAPTRGFSGAASFKYTVSNGFGPSSEATVSLTVGAPVWFVGPGAGAGTYESPVNCLTGAACLSAAGPAANAVIFLSSGSYTGGFTLASGQKLIGAGSSVSLSTAAGFTWPPDSPAEPSTGQQRPVLGGGLTLASTNTLRGFDLGDASGASLGGTNFGTLTVREVAVTNTTGQALSLVTGTADATFGAVSSTGGTRNVHLEGVGGTLALGGGALQGATGAGLFVSGGNAALSYAGAIANTADHAVFITGRTGGTITLGGTVSASGKGIRVENSTAGTVTFAGTGTTVNTGANPAVSLVNNAIGTVSFTGGALTITTTSGNGFSATGGGTVHVTGADNTITSAGGVALTVQNTTIGASGLTFRSLSANGGASGIVLHNTGSTAGLTVTGAGTAGTGGTIQNSTGPGVSLTSTLSPSFAWMNIQSTGASGVAGSAVTNFSFTNGVIDHSGVSEVPGRQESNIDFFANSAPGTENNLAGTVTITGNTLTNALYHGVDIGSYAGTISTLNVSNNTVTSSTSTTASKGTGIRVIALGGAGNVASVTRATIASNVITNFPSDAGIMFQGGNANAGAPSGTYGVPGSATDVISIIGNRIRGASASNRLGTQAILATVNGRGQGNFNISNNGTVAEPITNVSGHVISHSVFGQANVRSTVANNRIVANNSLSSHGISVGVDSTTNMATTAVLNLTVSDNSVSRTDGTGIYTLATRRGTANARITNNTVAAPVSSTYGMQVLSATSTTNTGTICVALSGNTTAGQTDGLGTTFPGIGLRRQSGAATAPNIFGIVGLSPSPTGTPTVENYVNSQNSSTSGSFGTGGTALFSASTGFTSCTLPF